MKAVDEAEEAHNRSVEAVIAKSEGASIEASRPMDREGRPSAPRSAQPHGRLVPRDGAEAPRRGPAGRHPGGLEGGPASHRARRARDRARGRAGAAPRAGAEQPDLERGAARPELVGGAAGRRRRSRPRREAAGYGDDRDHHHHQRAARHLAPDRRERAAGGRSRGRDGRRGPGRRPDGRSAARSRSAASAGRWS